MKGDGQAKGRVDVTIAGVRVACYDICQTSLSVSENPLGVSRGRVMETIAFTLQLDPQTLGRARQLADSRHCTVEELLKACIESLGGTEAVADPFLGMFAQEPA